MSTQSLITCVTVESNNSVWLEIKFCQYTYPQLQYFCCVNTRQQCWRCMHQLNAVRTSSKRCWKVHRCSQTALISSWQLDVAEITQFNTHGCCVIMAALLSRWETSHLFNPAAPLLFCKLLAFSWRRQNSHCLSSPTIHPTLINHIRRNISNTFLSVLSLLCLKTIGLNYFHLKSNSISLVCILLHTLLSCHTWLKVMLKPLQVWGSFQ